MSLLTVTLRALARRRLRRMRELAQDPAAAQAQVLDRLLAAARRTAFGREHGLARVRSYAAFRDAVPLTDYARMDPWWRRARAGEPDVAWPGVTRLFGLSSGTTSGEKVLPITEATVRTNRRGGFDNLAPYLVERADRLAGGRLLFLSGTTSLVREGPARLGDNTGVMAARIPWPLARLRLPSPEVSAIRDGAERLARTVATCLGEDVRLVAGLPSWALVVAQEVLAAAHASGRRAERLTDVWPRLDLLLHGGTTFAPYAERLRALLGREAWTLEGWSATEGGMLAVQDRPDDPGLVPLVDLGVFFELVPLEELRKAHPVRLPLCAAEPGTDYAVALTTNAGLYAYLLGDVVRFDSVRPYRLRFAGRVAHTLNAFGEHLSAGELEHAVLEAGLRTGARVREYAVSARFPDDGCPTGGHVWYVEFEGPAPAGPAFAAALDGTLRAGSADYDAHRIRRFGLAPPEVVAVPPGTFLQWMAGRRRVGGQAKVPRVLRAEQAQGLASAASALAGRAPGPAAVAPPAP